MSLIVILLVAIGLPVAVYLGLERLGRRAAIPLGLRLIAGLALGILVADLSCARPPASLRPVVLLDASLSMAGAGGQWAEARQAAAHLGDWSPIGRLTRDSAPDGGRSLIAASVGSAAAAGRPVWLVTDGEIEDVADLPADILAQVGVKTFPRTPVPDLALTRVAGPSRVTVGDTLRFELDVAGFQMADRKEVTIDVADGSTRWMSGTIKLTGGNGTGLVEAPLPAAASPGDHLLTISIRGAADGEPRTDRRLHAVTVVPTPGVVVVAGPTSWESRFFFRTLVDVSALPVRGYFSVDGTRWSRMGELTPASPAEVEQAAGRADLLVIFGDPPARFRPLRRARWEWVATSRSAPPAEGDWYLLPAGQSPVAGALMGLPVDSFPPGVGIAALTPGPKDWVGLSAQINRRGIERPAMIGRDSAGHREVLVGAAGLWRWTFRGGSSDQGYRSLIAATTSWLLGGSDSTTGVARPLRAVAPRGRPIVFERLRAGLATAAIEIQGGPTARTDTLRFDGTGRAALQLDPGAYHYRLQGGGAGALGVEEYSDEWLPRPVRLTDHQPAAVTSPTREPLRDQWWLFAVAAAALCGEWWWRRRNGLR